MTGVETVLIVVIMGVCILTVVSSLVKIIIYRNKLAPVLTYSSLALSVITLLITIVIYNDIT